MRNKFTECSLFINAVFQNLLMWQDPLMKKKKKERKKEIEQAKLIFGYHYSRTPLFQSPRGNGKSSK